MTVLKQGTQADPQASAPVSFDELTYVCCRCGRHVPWSDGADDEAERVFGPICDACATTPAMIKLFAAADDLERSPKGVRLRGRFIAKESLRAVLAQRGLQLMHESRGVWLAVPKVSRIIDGSEVRR